MYLQQVVGTHQPDESIVRVARRQRRQRISGKRGAQPRLYIGHTDARFNPCDGMGRIQPAAEFGHAVFRLQGVLRRDHPPHFIQRQCLQRRAADVQMPIVRRVKGAAENTDAALRPGGQCSLLRRVGADGYARHLPANDIGQRGDDLLRLARHRVSGTIDFLERVVVLNRVQGDVGDAQRARLAGVEGGVPLFIFLAKTDHGDVCIFQKRLRADGVELRALAVVPELVGLGTEYGDTAIVRVFVHRDRRDKLDRQAGFLNPGGDTLAPVGVNLARQIDGPGVFHRFLRMSILCR